MSDTSTIQTTCSICRKTLKGKKCDWDTYKQHISEYSEYVRGYQCQNCGDSFCTTGHKRELQFSLWSGYEKSPCPKCGESLRSGQVILQRDVKMELDATPAPTSEMREGEISEVCPICDSPAIEGTEYCTSCGYEFASRAKGVGPFTFNFETVQDAYLPSGKGTLAAKTWMLALGLPVALFGGWFLGLADLIITEMVKLIGDVCASWYGVLLVFAAYVFAGGGLGAIIGAVVGVGAKQGKTRNRTMVVIISLICSMLAFTMFVAFRNAAHGAEAFDSAIDTIKAILYLAGITGVAAANAVRTITKTPFCENCEQFMKETTLAVLPFGYEQDLMKLLPARRFIDTLTLFPGSLIDEENVCKVMLWHCNECKVTGYLNVTSTQTRYEYDSHGVSETKKPRRLIYSSALKPDEINTLLTNTRAS